MSDNATRTCKTALLDLTPDNRGLDGFRFDLQLQIFEVLKHSQKDSAPLNM